MCTSAGWHLGTCELWRYGQVKPKILAALTPKTESHPKEVPQVKDSEVKDSDHVQGRAIASENKEDN